MAKITLPTNYRDDILNTSAEGKRKYVMSYNQDGTVSFEDVTPYEQVGSDFGACDINTANEAINQSFDKNKLIRGLDTINALTEEGYAVDALSVKQINESLEWKFVGNGTGNNASVTLPNTFREVMVLATPDNTNRYVQTVMFPKMSSNGTLGQSLYWESNSTSSAYIIILIDYSNNKVIIGGSSNTTNCYMQVFAR